MIKNKSKRWLANSADKHHRNCWTKHTSGLMQMNFWINKELFIIACRSWVFITMSFIHCCDTYNTGNQMQS